MHHHQLVEYFWAGGYASPGGNNSDYVIHYVKFYQQEMQLILEIYQMQEVLLVVSLTVTEDSKYNYGE